MKTSKLFLFPALLFGIMSFGGCKQDNDDEMIHKNAEMPEFYALDISEETDWDYVVAAGNEEGSSVWFNIDKTANIPTTLFFKPISNQDAGFTVKFKSNGLPDYAIFGDTIVVFENFNDTTCDMAVIYPNISVKYFTNVETGEDWDNIGLQAFNSLTLKSVSPETRIAFQHGLKFVGSALAVVGAAAAICNPAGLTVLGAIAVVSAVATIANNYWIDNMAVGVGSTVAGKVVTMVGCAGVISNPYSSIECFSGLAGFVASASSDAMAFAESRQGLVNTVGANMKQNPDNPNNPNVPKEPNVPGSLVNKPLMLTLSRAMKGGSESHTCVLKPNRVAQIGSYTGSWEQGGNSLRINWKLNNAPDCTYRLTGTLNGNAYSGTYTHYDGSKLYDRGSFTGTMSP